MKTSLFVPGILCLFVLSCHKDWPPLQPGARHFQVTQLTAYVGYAYDSLIFRYDQRGNPVSITRASTGTGTSAPNYLFRYDRKGRVTDIIGAYDGGQIFDTWRRLYYNDKNQIVLDSTYEFGAIGEIPLPAPGRDRPRPDLRNISTYRYDHKNRMVRSTDTYGRDTVYVTREYIYNAAGNIGQVLYNGTPTQLQYDNKVSMSSTHPIWQFIDRDYSVNNPFVAVQYSRYGLPLVVDPEKEGYGGFAGIGYSGRAIFKYNHQ